MYPAPKAPPTRPKPQAAAMSTANAIFVELFRPAELVGGLGGMSTCAALLVGFTADVAFTVDVIT